MSSEEIVESESYSWSSVADWIQLILAVVLFFVAIFSPNDGDSYVQVWWGVVLAIFLGGFALWALAAPNGYASILEGITGVVIFIMPWFGGAVAGWAWFVWCAGILAVILAFWSYYSAPASVGGGDDD